jgi:4-amino-4-deoxy-L-arabinose transferase-like glycosyltransferase
MLFDEDNRLKQRDFWLLGVITFLGVLHRLFLARGILPYIRNTDEVVNMNVVLQMLGTRTLNPHFFNYPSLWFYLQAADQVLYQAVMSVVKLAWVRPGEISTITFGITRVEDIGQFFLARALSVLIGGLLTIAAVWLSYLISRDRRVALLTAALVTISPPIVYSASVATPDILAGLSATLFLCCVLLLFRQNNFVVIALVGITLGLTAASKYNAVVLGIALLFPVLKGILSIKQFALVLALSSLAFVLLVPYSILDFHSFIDGLQGEITHYSTGHLGAQGNSLGTNIGWLYNSIGPLSLFAPAVFFSRNRKNAIVVATSVVVFTLVLSVPLVRFERNLVPVFGALIALAAFGLISIVDRLRGKLQKVLVVVISCVLVLAPLHALVVMTSKTFEDPVSQSRNWLNQNAKAQDLIILDVYAPYIEPTRFQIVTDSNILENLDSLLAMKPHFVVLTKGGALRSIESRDRLTLNNLEKLNSLSCEKLVFDDENVELFQLKC